MSTGAPPLQNHPGDHEFPVRPRRRHALEVSRRSSASGSYVEQRRGLWPLLVPFALFFLLLLPQAAVRPHLPGPLRAEGAYAAAVCGLVLVLVVGLVAAGVRRAGSLPLREQERYRALAGTTRPTEHQQLLLALVAHSDWTAARWNSSLEPVPSWRCLPEEVRRLHEHTGRRLFLTLPLDPVAAVRAQLDHDHRIAGAGDLDLLVADVLAGGGYSTGLAELLAGDRADAALARLASLTGEDEWSLRERARPADGRPSTLLRGADARWLVGVVRWCYVAEHVDADRAWELLEQAGRLALAASGSWEEHWASCRTAVAVVTDSLEQVQAFDADLARLRAGDWPAASLPWPDAGSTAPGTGSGG